MTPIHRMTLVPGVYVCGARKANGARACASNRLVTCPDCRAKTKAKRAEAKARFAALVQDGKSSIST